MTPPPRTLAARAEEILSEAGIQGPARFEAMTPGEAQKTKWTGLSLAGFYREIERGTLGHLKHASAVRVRWLDLALFVAERERGAVSRGPRAAKLNHEKEIR